jgi:ech hydrogenase subunit E
MTEKKTIGPYHPYLLEPWKVDLTTDGDYIKEAKVTTGFAHRGIERLLESNSYRKGLFIAERVCGICSVVHTNTFSQTVESLFGIEAPERARFLRVAYLELERLHSHYLNLAMMAHACHFPETFKEVMLGRELVMGAMESLAGNRVNLGAIVIGGVRRNPDPKLISKTLKIVPELRSLSEKAIASLDKSSPMGRLCKGIGTISGDKVVALGGIGPVARGSGVEEDIRSTDPYAAYKELGFKMTAENGCDVLSRTRVRALETLESLRLIETALNGLPDGKIVAPLEKPSEGERLCRSEAPRGEVAYYMKSGKGNSPMRVKIRTPTFANHMVLMEMLKGQMVSDAQKIIESIDPCLSCTDR